MSALHLILLVCVFVVASNASTCMDDLDCLDKHKVCVHGVCMGHCTRAEYVPVESASLEMELPTYRGCYPPCGLHKFCDYKVGICQTKDPRSLYY
uniref:Uncharacterized protein n=1 Tax=Ditylenchus dipsaci TaxID=166011 RepID=A0A915E5L4_9BILA